MEIILGIDWGSSKIGLAMADSDMKMAVPWGTVKTVAEVVAIIQENQVDKIIIGTPMHQSGDLANQEGLASFVDELKNKIDLPIEFIDERLTSKLADKLRNQAGDRQAKKAMADQDAIAAMLILETYLEKIKM
jgi:putative Holliday junction resolvase